MAVTPSKRAEILRWLGESTRFACIHCNHVHQVADIRGRAGDLQCPCVDCDGNPADWIGIDELGRLLNNYGAPADPPDMAAGFFTEP